MLPLFRVCTCFVAYLCAVLPPIWLIELDRLEDFNNALDENSTLIELASVNGVIQLHVWIDG
jgi:hypothetical protein